MSMDASQSHLVDNLIAEFSESQSRDRLHHTSVLRYAQGARHFVVWLDNEGTRLADAADGLLQRFARHSCECACMTDPNGPRVRRNSQPPERFGLCVSWKREI